MVVGHERTESAQRTDRLFHALADATRRDIVTRTMGRDRSVSELARLYPMSFAAVQKHVAVLADAGLVSKHRRGRERLVRGEVGRMHEVHRLLDELEAAWRDRLDRFGAVLADETPPDHRPRRKQP
jgi:DNA-binding transcriptional ArsR family regulator